MRELGVDIGSVSLKRARFNCGRLEGTDYRFHHGRPFELLREVLAQETELDRLYLTGSVPAELGGLLGAVVVNEVEAAVQAVLQQAPEIRSVIEIGGVDSKLVLLDGGIRDFSSNTICAAGAGIFLDQQAKRLNLDIAELGRLAAAAQNPARIAGRCSVFAKSDMIHLQQIGTPVPDLIAGLCLALARNFKAAISRGKEITPPALFIGGVAANPGMVQALRKVLGLDERRLLVPEHFSTMAAIGCVLAGRGRADPVYAGPAGLDAWLRQERIINRLPPLNGRKQWRPSRECRPLTRRGRAWLGVDIGSISTNLVLINEQGEVIARQYLWTRGQPIQAVMQGLQEFSRQVGGLVDIQGVGTTGSGRYLIGRLIGADLIKNEISAQARASREIDPAVDTIFEIGGQDSKYISLDHGTIVDFEMNKVCAAGTGSFLEEQAQALNVDLEEFGDRALTARSPINLGERCTVFIGSEVIHHQQNRTELENLLAGLGYSTVYNYLNRVVGSKKVGNKIFFQGGVAANKAVVSAFEEILHKPVIVPPNHDVTGAWGIALLARDAQIEKTRFRGFDLAQQDYQTETFTCRQCSNECEINRIAFGRQPPVYYGGRCEKYENGGRGQKSNLPDYFRLRNDIFFAAGPAVSGPTIGLPRSLITYELFPFLDGFLRGLGFNPVLSEPTNRRILEQGVELAASDTCLPVKIALGHVQHLLAQGIKSMFLPAVISLPKHADFFTRSFVCPNIQTLPDVVRAVFGDRVDVQSPALYFDRGRAGVEKSLFNLGRQLGASRPQIRRALQAGAERQQEVEKKIRETGRQILSALNQTAFVICGRAYNGYDLGLNLDLPKIIRDLGVPCLPIDFLPLDFSTLQEDFYNMYWHCGQRLLAAAETIRRDPRLYPVYISNFSCGPDSFLVRFFKEKLGRKPALFIEVDEHSGDAGFVTRCEAFYDSLHAAGAPGAGRRISPVSAAPRDRTIYIPDMCDQARILAAAMRFAGYQAEVLPFPDESSILIGRQFTSGRECLPAIITAGDMIKKFRAPDFDPGRSAFLMAQGSGPCRFGQYYKMHRLILDEAGLTEVPLYAPNQGPSLFDDLGPMGVKFLTLIWNGICAVDALEAKSRQIRPYESEPGATDAVYQQILNELVRAIEQGQSIMPVLKSGRGRLEQIHRQPAARPRIGIVGEIYVRSQRFSNQHIIRRLEDLGAEVSLPSIAEWFFYTNFTRVKNCAWFRQYRRALFTRTFDAYMRFRQHRIYQAAGLAAEPGVEHLIRRGAELLNPAYEGEAILSVGKTMEFIAEGYSGVVNVMPFTCMPGNIVAAMFKRIREQVPDFPLFVLAYDGVDHAADAMRLETFVHQCRQYSRRRRPS